MKEYYAPLIGTLVAAFAAVLFFFTGEETAAGFFAVFTVFGAAITGMVRTVQSFEPYKIDKAYDHIAGIRRNYPDWPSTFGECVTEGCRIQARGGGLCAFCHQAELAKYVGTKEARRFHQAVQEEAATCADLMRSIQE